MKWQIPVGIKKKAHWVACNWSLLQREQLMWRGIQRQFHLLESVMSDILPKSYSQWKEKLASIDFYFRIWTGHKLFLLKSLGNQKKHRYAMSSNWLSLKCNWSLTSNWSLNNQLMWNDIEKQIQWKSNQLICYCEYE